MKDPATMTAGQINRELDALDKRHSKTVDEMIAAGRGYETSSETMRKTDPLALRYIAVVTRQQDLRNEISLRYGPGAPTRLPTKQGFGPRHKDPT